VSRFKWHILPSLPEGELSNVPGRSPLIMQLLHNRGLTGPSDYELFLNADSRLSGDPFLLPDMGKAISRIYRSLLTGENIVIYGDFDCDGITSTALLTEGLKMLGGRVTPYIPHRLTEGYGLNNTALEKLRQDGAELLVTCDCGVTAIPEIKKATKMGLDIVITDHHVPLDELPPALAVVNPKRTDSKYPFTELAGVGVAFKLMQALFNSLGQGAKLEGLLDLVALGTVADIVPLLGENRLLVKQGLVALNNSARPGIREMLIQAKVTGEIDTEKISWILAPRLNTPGRLEHAMASYNLLTTDSAEEARQITTWLEQKNTERQKLTADAQIKAREQVAATELTPLLFVEDTEFPAGVSGLVANRLADEFYRPAIVVRTGEAWSTGSCRSIPEFNIINALKESRQLLNHFGGHAQAAGFTIPTHNLPQLKRSLIAMAATALAGIDLRPRVDIDAIISLGELVKGNVYQAIQQLAPFGQGNPVPTFLSLGVNMLECRTMGLNGEHLHLRLKQDGSTWDGVAFQQGNCLGDIKSPLDIVYNLEMDRWNGRETIRLNIVDMAPSQPR
jgi:single-stranded-DNA-specific exonuclease